MMGEEGNRNTESQTRSQSVASIATPSPSPSPSPLPTPDHSPLHKGKEPKNPHTSNGVGQGRSLIPVSNPKHQPISPHVQKVENPDARTNTGNSIDRDAVLARVEAEKRLALIKAWEESEKTKVENRAYKMHSAIGLWEDSKKASVEAKLKRIEEKLERKKAEYVEKMQNKIAEIHQSAEEKRASVKAQKEEQFMKVEETAAKFRTRGRGYSPRKLLPCFSG